MKIVLILVVLGLLGAAYGFVSGNHNQNPFYSVDGDLLSPSSQTQAWHWSPSRLWLPSYLLCTVPSNGYGITRTRSGFLFRSEASRQQYVRGSVALGFVFGLVLGAVCSTVVAYAGRKRIV